TEGLLLDGLGFEEGQIFETIVTTMDHDGSVNAAPMGVVRTGRETLEIRPFKSSSTYRNLSSRPEACVNVTDDPVIFLVTAFKGTAFRGFEEPSLDGIRLREADAHVFISVRDIDDSEDRARFTCNVDSVEVGETGPRPFSRGRAQAIEAVIHATRLEFLYREGRVEEAEELVRRFSVCKDVVGKVSTPDSTEGRVIRELERLIEGWRGG
ncbi:DUF447 family protein, partial [Candidatus Bathyarchaeota archaeon]|nr:DUF447 family protein [Candidatus Bathyarchaeota archaeon]